MAQMRVDEVVKSASGKVWRMRSGDRWFNCPLDGGIEKQIGKTIDAEVSTHEKFGDGIPKYRVVGEVYTTTDKAPAAAQNAHRAPIPYPTSPHEQTVAPYWQPFVSNQVASAIAAKLITKPEELKVWTFAAMNAIKGAVEGDVSV